MQIQWTLYQIYGGPNKTTFTVGYLVGLLHDTDIKLIENLRIEIISDPKYVNNGELAPIFDQKELAANKSRKRLFVFALFHSH